MRRCLSETWSSGPSRPWAISVPFCFCDGSPSPASNCSLSPLCSPQCRWVCFLRPASEFGRASNTQGLVHVRERRVLREHCDSPEMPSPLTREQPQNSGILHTLLAPPPVPIMATSLPAPIFPLAFIQTTSPSSLGPQESDPISHPQTQSCLRGPNDPRLAGAGEARSRDIALPWTFVPGSPTPVGTTPKV